MSGIVALDELLKSMSPEIQEGEYVFCTLAGENLDYKHLNPLATFKESEGLTLIIPVESAVQEKLAFECIFKQIGLGHNIGHSVGWVERSETQQLIGVGFRSSTQPTGKSYGLNYDQGQQITLTVHSSLEAVGLTAAVANKLASYGISANVIAAFYHDHVFVQKEKAEQALSALNEFRAELNC